MWQQRKREASEAQGTMSTRCCQFINHVLEDVQVYHQGQNTFMFHAEFEFVSSFLDLCFYCQGARHWLGGAALLSSGYKQGAQDSLYH